MNSFQSFGIMLSNGVKNSSGGDQLAFGSTS
jgi:hypothetical protein